MRGFRDGWGGLVFVVFVFVIRVVGDMVGLGDITPRAGGGVRICI